MLIIRNKNLIISVQSWPYLLNGEEQYALRKIACPNFQEIKFLFLEFKQLYFDELERDEGSINIRKAGYIYYLIEKEVKKGRSTLKKALV